LEEGNEKALVEIASAAFAEDNIKCDAPALLGSLSAALERVMDAHLSFGDAVVVEDPCPTEVLDLCRTLGLNPVAVPVDAQGPLAEPFAAAVNTRVRGVIVSSRAQNPTSAAISVKRGKLLKRALTAHPDIFLIEYDPLGSSAGVPLVSIRDNQRTNYASIRTLGYVLGNAASMAAVAGDKETLGRIEGRLRVGGQVVNPILQRTLIGFCEPEHRILQEAVEETYEARREALAEALNACGIESWGTSGNYVWVPVPEEYPVAQSLRDAGWAVTPGERFRLQTGPGIRIVTASLPEERAEHLARDLQTILQSP
jgi:DNA-binding transcriptional MocR family regulator